MADDDKNKLQPAGGGSPSPLSAVGAAAPKLAWEEWAAKVGVPHWKADAARHGRGWPLGKEVSEDEFNQAVYDAFNLRIG